jgi:hypothetical protein
LGGLPPGASIAVESACKADRRRMSPQRAAPAATLNLFKRKVDSGRQR